MVGKEFISVLWKTWNSNREIKKYPYVIYWSLRSVVGGYCFLLEKLNRICLSRGKRNLYSNFSLLIKYYHIAIFLIEESHKEKFI